MVVCVNFSGPPSPNFNWFASVDALLSQKNTFSIYFFKWAKFAYEMMRILWEEVEKIRSGLTCISNKANCGENYIARHTQHCLLLIHCFLYLYCEHILLYCIVYTRLDLLSRDSHLFANVVNLLLYVLVWLMLYVSLILM